MAADLDLRPRPHHHLEDVGRWHLHRKHRHNAGHLQRPRRRHLLLVPACPGSVARLTTSSPTTLGRGASWRPLPPPTRASSPAAAGPSPRARPISRMPADRKLRPRSEPTLRRRLQLAVPQQAPHPTPSDGHGRPGPGRSHRSCRVRIKFQVWIPSGAKTTAPTATTPTSPPRPPAAPRPPSLSRPSPRRRTT